MRNREVSYHTLHFICSLTKALRPKQALSVSEWAEKNMVLPAGSNTEGKYTTASAPYQKEIMDAISDPMVRDVVVMSSAQVGKTLIILCGIGYYIDYEPATQLLVLPTLVLGEKFSKSRLANMIRDVAVLSDKIAAPKSKNSDNTVSFKQYPGGYIIVAGANSPASLSSMPIRVVWMDEIDRFADSAGKEGNPIKLAQKRATSYWNKKFIKASTPTISGKSNIEKEYKEGSQEEWNVMCPSCGAYQPYEFDRIVFDSVSMVCKECGEVISEMDWKSSKHKWIAACPENKKKRSFRLNEFAAPWVQWSDIIDEHKKAYKEMKENHNPKDMITFVNTTLGECWDETDQEEYNVDEDTLENKAEHYEADIPNGVLLLTASVDVQDDRFEIEVKGWGRDYENWGIYKTEIYGELEYSAVWEELEEYLGSTFYFANGRELNIAGVAIDTGGHHTQRVYKWIKSMKQKGKKVYGIKGYSQKPVPLVYKRTKVEIKETGRNGKEKVVDSTIIHIIGVDAGKESISRWLTLEEKGEGYCHFPSNPGRGYDRKYYEGLLSEKQIYKEVRGKVRKVWVKKNGVRNEPLDLFNYNYACCELIRPRWDDLERKLAKGVNYVKKHTGIRKSRRATKGMEM